jgi:hypothetical protein
MALSLTGPLNQLDIYRIVHDFDRGHFKIKKPQRHDQMDLIRVINQFERLLASFGIPLELIDNIMRRYLQNPPSVGALLMCYKNTPAIILLHPLPLSTEPHYINTASKSLLVQLKQTPTDGELASYRKLMTWIFKSHFKKLTLDQKLELIRRSNITPWEQRTTSQKLELLGRIQAPTFWGQAKLNLQLLSWKVQFAAVWSIENNVIAWVVGGSLGVLIFSTLLLRITQPYSFANTGIYQALRIVWAMAALYLIFVLVTLIATLVVSPFLTVLGLVLQIPILPKFLQDKGARIQSISWAYFCFIFRLFFDNRRRSNESVYKELQQLLLQSINKTNITIEQNTFANAHFPDLLDKWINLISPSDTNTGSLQIDTQEQKQLI